MPRFRLGRTLAATAVLIALLAGLPSTATGHALLLSSKPVAGSTLGSAPTTIELTFGEAPDPKLSGAKVLDASGGNHATGPVAAVPGKPLELDVPVGALGDGVYTVAWRTVSSVDGHVAAGSFAFGVGVAVTRGSGAPTTATASPSASLFSDAARWLLYLGLMGLFGAAFFGLAIEPGGPRAVVRLAGGGWVAAAIGGLGVTAAQWSDAGGDVGTLLGTSVGLSAMERLGTIAVAGALVALLLSRRPPAGRRLFGLVALAAAAAMLADVLTGHAAAGSLAPFQVATQWLHIASAGLWMGGLAALLLTVRGQPDDAKAAIGRRYATWAGIGLLTVAVTGMIRAISEIGTLDALVSTDYGRVVLIKTGSLGLLAILGASNHYINIPAAAKRLTGLRRVGSTELAIGVGVIALSALLVNLAPPISSTSGSAGLPPPQPIIASGHDFGTSVKVRLVITPGSPGPNAFAASVTDYDSGAPRTAASLSLRFAVQSSKGIGGSSLAMQAGAPGSFSASGTNLSLDGIWSITATVAGTGASGAAGTVEVPLTVATVVPPQPVDGDATPLSPATVHLADGSSVQVYLDPGGVGSNELHATFFDAAGAERPIPTAFMLLSAQDGSTSMVVPRQLEPGHFVADIVATAGPLAVDVVGDGGALGTVHAHLVIGNT
jgi:copper transport protein